jgi:hypothetical protein
MKTIKDYFKQFEEKVVGIVEMIDGVEVITYSAKPIIFKSFNLVSRFIKAQYNLETQRDLWLKTIDLLNASKAFDDEVKEEIREELLVDCFKELENLNNTILQLQTQKTTTNKPDEKFNWQGKQAQLVYLIEQLYEHGFLSPITQPEKFSLLSQHFTVKGKNLNQKNLANTKRNNNNNKSGKPRDGEKIDEIISAVKKQNP